MKTTRGLLFGALTVGSLDLLDALVFYGRRGIAPIRILQSIATGVLGRAAFSDGIPAACLGVFLHFFIAFGIVVAYYLISRTFPPVMRRHPIFCGVPYGLLVYVAMNFVVVPLSRAASGSASGAALANLLLIHAFGVGLPAAMFVWLIDRRPPAAALRR